jgi:hypothetical protein
VVLCARYVVVPWTGCGSSGTRAEGVKIRLRTMRMDAP